MEFINIKNSLRALSDEDFENILPELARDLSKMDYHFSYTEKELHEDWIKLCKYNNSNFFTAAQTRPGMKLCEHFFPNFFDIVNNKNDGFKNHWNEEDLKKVIRWNRNSHSTPYMSEMRRGINFCFGLTKNTMFRPHLAKMICNHYQIKTLLDVCCGWGGRMLGTVASGATYIGYEPNTETFHHLKELAAFLNIEDRVTLFNEGAENQLFDFHYDAVLTSPPYYNLEIYSNEKTQSENQYNSYDEWLNGWLIPLLAASSARAKVCCWNVANIGKMNLQNDVINWFENNGWKEDCLFGINSSARQANQNELKNKKNIDKTICFLH